MKFRQRIKGMKMVRASSLVHHTSNPRLHPQKQKDAMRAVLEGIGFADALLTYTLPDGRYALVEGHMRSDMVGDEEVAILETDLSEEEATRLITVFDQVGRMADIDRTKLDDLIRKCDFHEGAIAAMLAELQMQTKAAMDKKEDGVTKKAEDASCQYPITPVFNERYDYVVIFSKNTMEWAWLVTQLGLEKQRNYKNSFIGIGRVLSFEEFQKKWDARGKENTASGAVKKQGDDSVHTASVSRSDTGDAERPGAGVPGSVAK